MQPSSASQEGQDSAITLRHVVLGVELEGHVLLRLVVTFVSAPGEPEYLTVINEWKLDQYADGSQLHFQVPADWRRIDARKVALPAQQ